MQRDNGVAPDERRSHQIWAAATGLALLLCAFGAAAADPFIEGIQAANESDRRRAIELLEPLADHGNGVAAVIIGRLYRDGIGGPKDPAAAIRWFRVAADSGELEGDDGIASMFASGNGVPKDQDAAISWYLKAAEKAYFPAQFNLGTLYADPRSGRGDKVLAYMWFTIASRFEPQPSPPGFSALDMRKDVEEKMTSAQIAVAQNRASRWLSDHQMPRVAK